MIRVGRRIYNKTGGFQEPSCPEFKPIRVLTKSTEYGSIGPYELKDDLGRIMENIWQFAKVYQKVPASKRSYSQYSNKIIWNHPAEVHIDENGILTPEYWNWRKKGMHNPDAVRYPLGFGKQHNCLYALDQDDQGNLSPPLDYIQARKAIYLPVYCDMVKKETQFIELKKRLENGEKLLIIEVDGPHQECLDYYREKYGVDEDFIENYTMLVNEENIRIMLNDPKFPFGHGYCLAMALLDKDKAWNY